MNRVTEHGEGYQESQKPRKLKAETERVIWTKPTLMAFHSGSVTCGKTIPSTSEKTIAGSPNQYYGEAAS